MVTVTLTAEQIQELIWLAQIKIKNLNAEMNGDKIPMLNQAITTMQAAIR